MERKMTLAFLGNGKSTNRYHLPFLLERKDRIQVKKIWERNPSADIWPKVFGIRYVRELREILEDQEIDAVTVATPPSSHYPLARAVLEAGKHCVCEKPFTCSLAEAEELFRLAEEKKVTLQCYQNRRFDSDFLTVQKVLRSGKLGRLYEAEMNFDYYRPDVPEREEKYCRERSFLYAHACHMLDQAVSLWGMPARVEADVRALLGRGRMNDYYDIDLFYGNWKVSVRSSYFRAEPRPGFLLYGQRGTFVKKTPDRQERDLKHFYMPENPDFGIDLPEDYGTMTWYDEKNVFHREAVISERGDYGRYYDALADTVLMGKEPLVRKEEILFQMKILEQCIRQMER